MLAFDFSFGPLVALVLEDGRALATLDRHDADAPRGEELVQALAGLLDDAGRDWGELDLLAVTVGPGSFTGVRAAVAAARGVALATGRPVLPLDTLALLEQSVRAGAGATGPLLVAAPGKRGSWYVREFAADGVAVTASETVDCAVLRDRARRVGTLAGIRLERLGEPPAGVRTLAAAAASSGLCRLVPLALARGVAPVEGHRLEPTYLRGADADPRAGLPLLQRAAG